MIHLPDHIAAPRGKGHLQQQIPGPSQAQLLQRFLAAQSGPKSHLRAHTQPGQRFRLLRHTLMQQFLRYLPAGQESLHRLHRVIMGRGKHAPNALFIAAFQYLYGLFGRFAAVVHSGQEVPVHIANPVFHYRL